MPVLRDILPGAAAIFALAPTPARAGDLGLSGTPVVHQGEACLTRVDRSVDPIVHLDYTVPYADICLGPDEPQGSRTHQFIAFCRDAPVTQTVPPWLIRADLQASFDAGLLDPGDPSIVQDVLEDSQYFAGCWRPILSVADRRPITCEAARPGVDWDTRGLEPGPHIVAGHTYSPPLNHWQLRRGVFRVHDGDLDAAPPAAAIFTSDLDVWSDEVVRLAACVDAPPGSTLRAEYALAPDAPDVALTWQPFLSAHPAPSGDLELELHPAPEHAGQRLTVRLLVDDPQGRRAIAHMPGKVLILKTPAPMTGGDDVPPPEDPPPFDFCQSVHADDPPKCSSPAAQPEDGCTCTTAPNALPGLLCLLILMTRRRREPMSLNT